MTATMAKQHAGGDPGTGGAHGRNDHGRDDLQADDDGTVEDVGNAGSVAPDHHVALEPVLLVSLAVCVVVSLVTPAPTEDILAEFEAAK